MDNFLRLQSYQKSGSDTLAGCVANKTNRAIHVTDPSLKGKQIHEIHPVKLGGNRQ
jgi:hypothetical protein